MEVWSWAVVDKAASPKIKDVMRFVSQYRFSPSGVFEQDDMDNWIQVTGAAKKLDRPPPSGQLSDERQRAADRNRSARPSKSRFSDNNQLSLYMHWAKVLQAKNWNEIWARKNG